MTRHICTSQFILTFLRILTTVNAPSAVLSFDQICMAAVGDAPSAPADLHPSVQETIMVRLFRASAVTFAIFAGATFAAGQNAPNQAPGTAHNDLTSNQEQTIRQGLAASPSQPTPAGEQPQVGNKVPDSMTAQALPGKVTDQVPQAKELLFVKLPDRIILIDPDTKLVSQIVMDSDAATTGSNSGNAAQRSR